MTKTVARRVNVTGVDGLSIGTTKNAQGYQLKRYLVAYRKEHVPTNATFYFGENNSQYAAFVAATEFMKRVGYQLPDHRQLMAIYHDYHHEDLL